MSHLSVWMWFVLASCLVRLVTDHLFDAQYGWTSTIAASYWAGIGLALHWNSNP